MGTLGFKEIWLDSQQNFISLCDFVQRHWNITKETLQDFLEDSSSEEEEQYESEDENITQESETSPLLHNCNLFFYMLS